MSRFLVMAVLWSLATGHTTAWAAKPRVKPVVTINQGAAVAARLESEIKAKTGMVVRFDPITMRVVSVRAKNGEEVRYVPSSGIDGKTQFRPILVDGSAGAPHALNGGCVTDRITPEPCEDDHGSGGYETALDEELPTVRPLSQRLETVVVSGRRTTENPFWDLELANFFDEFKAQYGDRGGPSEHPNPDPEPDPICLANRTLCLGAAEAAYAAGTARCAGNWQSDAQRGGLNRWRQLIAAAKLAWCQGTVEVAKAAAQSVCPTCK